MTNPKIKISFDNDSRELDITDKISQYLNPKINILIFMYTENDQAEEIQYFFLSKNIKHIYALIMQISILTIENYKWKNFNYISTNYVNKDLWLYILNKFKTNWIRNESIELLKKTFNMDEFIKYSNSENKDLPFHLIKENAYPNDYDIKIGSGYEYKHSFFYIEEANFY